MSDLNGVVYVVDDDASVREGLASLVCSAGLKSQAVASAREFLALPRADGPSCLVLDVKLPELSGIELQQELVQAGVQIPIIFLTGCGDIPMAVRALKAGAVEFLTKPVQEEDLLNAIRQCLAARDASETRLDLAHTAEKKPYPCQGRFGGAICIGNGSGFEGIVGGSPVLKRVLQLVETVAPSDSTVLLLGETGTGKELIARAVHNRSPRAQRPFVKLNCAAIPSGLLESELFGHERGAFTGAIARKLGRLELADQGSLLLDEIGDIPLELQPKLLRVLQEREFERLGSTRTQKVDVRIVAATHCDLNQMIVEKSFRSDLYYRLSVFPIRIPPLRERTNDIPVLVHYFVKSAANRLNKAIDSIPTETMEALIRHPWPGNIRELENVIERAVILSSGPALRIRRDDLEPRNAPIQSAEQLHTLEEVERKHILDTLKETRWALAGPNGAAARLGLNRSTLYFRMKKLGIARSMEASLNP